VQALRSEGTSPQTLPPVSVRERQIARQAGGHRVVRALHRAPRTPAQDRGSEFGDMVTSSNGMVQVSGATYRIVQRGRLHEVICVLDDLPVGTFRHRPTLRVVESRIPPERLLDIARQALRSARLAWAPDASERRPRLAVWTEAVAAWSRLLDYLAVGSMRLQPVAVPSRSRGRARR
jgi:hypothetical protein